MSDCDQRRGPPFGGLMLAVIEPARNDFHALAAYLVHGKERPTHPDRVAWTMSQNLGTDEPLLAAHFMAATAEMSKRCRNACYHLTINWHPDEQPSPEIMQEIARRTLAMADLGEHQALVMGHGDKAHRHLHMMINRVHPTTGRAWSTSHDYRRFDRIMKDLSEEYGFHYVPPHAFEPELTEDLPKGPTRKAHRAAKHGARTERPQWPKRRARLYGAQLSERLSHATSWDDINFLLAEDGLTLDAKGKGLIVGDKSGYAKFSALGLNKTAKGFEKRFKRAYVPPAKRGRPPMRKPGRNIWTVDAIDIARALGTRDQLRAAINEAQSQRKARRSKLPLLRQLLEELKEQWKASTALKRRTLPKPKVRRKPPPKNARDR